MDELFDKAGARGGNFEGWIAEAKLRAAGKRVARPEGRERTRSAALQGAQLRSCPQDLEQIQGIGRVYEQRLYAAGIGTFWEVGMVAQDELKSILEIQEFQDVDLDAIQADALRLARETDAMGQTWDGSEPDDFEELEGIGPVLERRLYSAGICTYRGSRQRHNPRAPGRDLQGADLQSARLRRVDRGGEGPAARRKRLARSISDPQRRGARLSPLPAARDASEFSAGDPGALFLSEGACVPHCPA